MTQRDWRGFDPDDPDHRAKRDALRAIMDALDMWRGCPLRACRRARRCAGARAACFFHHRATLLETALPEIRRTLATRLAQAAQD